MSTKMQLAISVPPGLVYNPVARLTSNGKIGKISLRLTQLIGFNNQSQPVAAGTSQFYFYESDDGVTWGDPLNTEPAEVVSGGTNITTLNLRKSFVKISGRTSDGRGSKARIDLDYDGGLYGGQLELSVFGKSGYGIDGGTGQGQGTGPIAEWPGQLVVPDDEVVSSPP